MRAVVIGSAAGGGFPQWNSGGPGCTRARAGDPAVRTRTQASLAVSADQTSWFLVNASPDLRQQIDSKPFLHPRALRDTPIAGVVLTGGEVDVIAGLLTLRERQRFTVFATAAVQTILDDNPVFEVLARDVVARQTVEPDTPFALTLPDGGASGLICTLFPVPGKAPLYMEGDAPALVEDGTTVGAILSDGTRSLVFIPGCARMTPALAARLDGADCVLFDGTLYTDDEMLRAGLGTKTGQRMGHMSMAGPDGAIATFANLRVGRKIFVHINNSNPVLMDDSAEHAAVRAAGWEVAWDGMEVFA